MKEAERGAWVASLRQQNPALASHLESLLQENQALSQEHFLEQGPVPSLPAQAAKTGQTFGPYTLVSLIGEGGMDSVWLAERSDGSAAQRSNCCAPRFWVAPAANDSSARVRCRDEAFQDRRARAR